MTNRIYALAISLNVFIIALNVALYVSIASVLNLFLGAIWVPISTYFILDYLGDIHEDHGVSEK